MLTKHYKLQIWTVATKKPTRPKGSRIMSLLYLHPSLSLALCDLNLWPPESWPTKLIILCPCPVYHFPSKLVVFKISHSEVWENTNARANERQLTTLYFQAGPKNICTSVPECPFKSLLNIGFSGDGPGFKLSLKPNFSATSSFCLIVMPKVFYR